MASSTSSSSTASSILPVMDFGIWAHGIFHHGIFASSDDLWRYNPYGGWATIVALFLILLYNLLRYFFSHSPKPPSPSISVPTPPPPTPTPTPTPTSRGDGVVITEDDLKSLILSLEDSAILKEKWDDVIEKQSETVCYKAKCCKPKDGPWKYLSVTEFANYSTEMLRDFYMDNEYRMQWDKTVVEHMQLWVDEATGTEMGRTVKKLPLLTAREYVLAWRLWEGKDNTFYCVTKACDHPSSPRSKKYVRVGFYKSGWRIRKVPGKNASEIKMIYQEDSGMNVEMTKLAFAKGVWGYVCKMESALQKYPEASRLRLKSSVNAITLAHKVPRDLEAIVETQSSMPLSTPAATTASQATQIISGEKKLLRKPSGQVVAKGLILLGGIVCLSRGLSSLDAKVAMGYLLTKLNKQRCCSSKPTDKQK